MVLVLASALLATDLASAHPVLALEYSAPAGCPDAASFQARLSARLGYEPSGAKATHTSRVTVSSGLTAKLELAERGAAAAGVREFEAGPEDCEALINSVALALAIALDPHVLAGPRRPASPAQSSDAPRPAEAAAPVPAPDAPPALGFEVTLSARASVGHLPAVAFGPGLEARLRRGAFSLALEAEADFARPMAAQGGRVESALVRGGTQLCGHLGFAGLCLRGTAGAMSVAGVGFVDAQRGWLAVATLGPQVMATWHPLTQLVLSVTVGADIALLRNSIGVGTTDVWSSPWVAGAFGLAVGWAPL
jgi:hypothetical protein